MDLCSNDANDVAYRLAVAARIEWASTAKSQGHPNYDAFVFNSQLPPSLPPFGIDNGTQNRDLHFQSQPVPFPVAQQGMLRLITPAPRPFHLATAHAMQMRPFGTGYFAQNTQPGQVDYSSFTELARHHQNHLKPAELARLGDGALTAPVSMLEKKLGTMNIEQTDWINVASCNVNNLNTILAETKLNILLDRNGLRLDDGQRIICLQEPCHLVDGDIVQIPGTIPFLQPGIPNAETGIPRAGVLSYIDKIFAPHQINRQLDSGSLPGAHDWQIIYLTIQNRPVVLINVYRAPQSAYVELFLALRARLIATNNQATPIILVGDFYCEKPNFPQRQHLFQFCAEFNVVDIVDEDTFHSTFNGWPVSSKPDVMAPSIFFEWQPPIATPHNAGLFHPNWFPPHRLSDHNFLHVRIRWAKIPRPPVPHPLLTKLIPCSTDGCGKMFPTLERMHAHRRRHSEDYRKKANELNRIYMATRRMDEGVRKKQNEQSRIRQANLMQDEEKRKKIREQSRIRQANRMQDEEKRKKKREQSRIRQANLMQDEEKRKKKNERTRIYMANQRMDEGVRKKQNEQNRIRQANRMKNEEMRKKVLEQNRVRRLEKKIWEETCMDETDDDAICRLILRSSNQVIEKVIQQILDL